MLSRHLICSSQCFNSLLPFSIIRLLLKVARLFSFSLLLQLSIIQFAPLPWRWLKVTDNFFIVPSKGNFSLPLRRSPSHQFQGWPHSSPQGSLLASVTPHISQRPFPLVTALSAWLCSRHSSGPSSLPTLISCMISSIPIALNAIYMLMTYKFMSPVHKSLRVRLIYPPGYLTSLLGCLTGILKKHVKIEIFIFLPNLVLSQNTLSP